MSASYRRILFALAAGLLPLCLIRAADSIGSIDYDAAGDQVHVSSNSSGQIQIKIPLNRHPVGTGQYSMTVDGETAVWTFPKESLIAPRSGHFDVFAASQAKVAAVTPVSTPIENRTEKVKANFSKPILERTTTLATVNANGVQKAETPTDQITAVSSPPPAADQKQVELQTKLKDWNLDRSIPESPAFTALGISPETVTRPASVREFGTALLNGVDKDGKLQSGVAIDVAPYQILAGQETTLPEYKNHPLTRILYNTQLSIGTAKATTDDKALRLAAGVNITLWDNGDPRLNEDIANLYTKNFVDHRPPPLNPFGQVQDQMDAYTKSLNAYEKDLQARVAEIRKKSWAKSSWIVAAAPTWITATGDANELKWDGATVWSSFAYGFEGMQALENKAQLIVNARYRNFENVAEPSDAKVFFRQDTFTVGARLRFGSPDFNASFEGAYFRTWSDAHGRDSAYRLGGNIERKIAENLWLTLALGQDFGDSPTGEQLFVVSGLRFGTSDKPQLTSGF
ncbi:MAG TPA: hypothetical protein VJU77_14190 [Chthoniobacterales bacterium]|nr:hypothetical protein [Chthoniobacterales bacterium]